MVDGIKTVPTEERKRQYEKNRRAWQGLVPDPEAAHDAMLERPFSERVATSRGAGYKPKAEMWRYPLRKDGTRKQGSYLREIPRDPFGRFAERFDIKKFRRVQGLKEEPKKGPVTRR